MGNTVCDIFEFVGRENVDCLLYTSNDACAEWKAAENIDYSIYGTPLESTTYKFAKCLQNRFEMCIRDSTCPKGLIALLPLYEKKAAVTCKNHNKGAFTRKE